LQISIYDLSQRKERIENKMEGDDKKQDRFTTLSGDRYGQSKMIGYCVGDTGRKDDPHQYIVATTDPAYKPASSAEFSEHDAKTDDLRKKIDNIYDQVCGKGTELLEPEYTEFEVKASKVNVISLCVASVLASLLIFIGIIAPLINGLPHRLFWLSMGLPAAGVAAGNILILLGHSEAKD
jgi:hypothetical protein